MTIIRKEKELLTYEEILKEIEEDIQKDGRSKKYRNDTLGPLTSIGFKECGYEAITPEFRVLEILKQQKEKLITWIKLEICNDSDPFDLTESWQIGKGSLWERIEDRTASSSSNDLPTNCPDCNNRLDWIALALKCNHCHKIVF